MQITIYSTTTCPYCKMLKDYLTQKGVAFTEKMVDTDEAARKEMETVSGGFLGVPFSVVVKNGSQESVIGFDKGKFDQILGVNEQAAVK